MKMSCQKNKAVIIDVKPTDIYFSVLIHFLPLFIVRRVKENRNNIIDMNNSSIPYSKISDPSQGGVRKSSHMRILAIPNTKIVDDKKVRVLVFHSPKLVTMYKIQKIKTRADDSIIIIISWNSM